MVFRNRVVSSAGISDRAWVLLMRRRLARITIVLSTILAVSGGLARTAHAQAGVISGTVVAERSQLPIAGAQIAVEGEVGKGAVSDGSGRFRISGLSGASVSLNAKMLGYRPLTLTVRVGATDARFVLAERPIELNQVVVTGTVGGEQKRALGTAVATISASELQANAPVTSVDALLSGRTPGVVVLPGTGMIGAGSNIRIRGLGTFSLSSQPLVYVDGIRVNNQTGSGMAIQGFGSGVVSRLNDFSADEIESIEVLKGPAAATLYGTEAARGVINIITKKGATGTTKYTLDTQLGSNWFQNAAGRIPTNYCIQTSPTACGTSGTGTILGLNVVNQENARGTPIFRTGNMRDMSGSVSGGNGLFRFFASGEISNNEGAETNNARRQSSFRTNLNITPSEKVDIATNFGYINSRTTLSCEAGCGGAMWASVFSNPANLPQFCPAGDKECTWVRGFQSAPPEADRAMQDWQDLNRLTASVTFDYKPFTWMSHRFKIGTDYNLENNVEYLPYLTNDTLRYFWGTYANGYRSHNQHEAVYNTYDYTGSASFNINAATTSKTSVGTQYYTRNDQFISGEGDFFPAPGLQTISSAGQKLNLSDGWSANNTLGFYAQEALAWSDRLFVTVAMRVDNNSSFGSQVHWVTYPKASVSYVASDDPFIRTKLPSWINSLRVRGAFGASGQQPALLTALQTLRPVAGPNGEGILTANSIGNANLKPERVVGTEVGFEVALLQDRFGVDFTYFHDDSRDAILSRQVAPSTGFSATNQFFNAGEIIKQGVELGLKGQIIDKGNFGWDVNFTVGTNSSKIQRLNGTDTTIDLGAASHRVGYTPFDWFSYKILSATYDATSKKAINPMCDNGKGQPIACYAASGAIQAPKVYLGHSIPAVEGALTNTVRYGSFRAYAMFNYSQNYKRLDNNLRARCQIFHTCLENLQPETVNPAVLAQMQNNGTLREFVISDASFVKFRELSVSYDVPERLAARFGTKQMALTVSGRNLGTWTKYTGLDPETEFVAGSPINVDQSTLPQLTSFVFRIHLSY